VGEHLAVYRHLVMASVRSQLAYPTSFALQCAGQALVQLEDMVVILVSVPPSSRCAGSAS
jgi:putative lipoic acid-binding regulatory protein